MSNIPLKIHLKGYEETVYQLRELAEGCTACYPSCIEYGIISKVEMNLSTGLYHCDCCGEEFKQFTYPK